MLGQGIWITVKLPAWMTAPSSAGGSPWSSTLDELGWLCEALVLAVQDASLDGEDG
jgi:hypothetical protein